MEELPPELWKIVKDYCKFKIFIIHYNDSHYAIRSNNLDHAVQKFLDNKQDPFFDCIPDTGKQLVSIKHLDYDAYEVCYKSGISSVSKTPVRIQVYDPFEDDILIYY